jgi:hypothetical protein
MNKPRRRFLALVMRYFGQSRSLSIEIVPNLEMSERYTSIVALGFPIGTWWSVNRIPLYGRLINEIL